MKRKRSKCWFIENVSTREKHFLNVGDFTIGRNSNKNDLNIDKNRDISESHFKHCSRVHCILKLSSDQKDVQLLNRVSNY